MRKVTLSVAEFMNFRELAKSFEILFDHIVKQGQVEVSAKDQDFLELGY